jgi:hypothetical protein
MKRKDNFFQELSQEDYEIIFDKMPEDYFVKYRENPAKLQAWAERYKKREK